MQMSHLSPDALSAIAITGTRAIGRAWTSESWPLSSNTCASSLITVRCSSSSMSFSSAPSITSVRSRSAPFECSPDTDEPNLRRIARDDTPVTIACSRASRSARTPASPSSGWSSPRTRRVSASSARWYGSRIGSARTRRAAPFAISRCSSSWASYGGGGAAGARGACGGGAGIVAASASDG